MPIRDLQDATDVDQRIGRVFAAHTTRNRTQALRRLFVNTLDFNQASGEISLAEQSANVDLPGSAHRVASIEGVHVIYIDLDETQTSTNRVRKDEASSAAKLISEQLGDDLLLVFTNRGASQLHLIYPHFLSAQPTLRRLIVERDLPRRTAVQQVANIYHEWQESNSLHKALDSVFDVEAVTRDFFTEYKRVFDDALDTIRGFGDSDDEREARHLFAQKLFNRLMFVYFLSRKGWLTFKGDKDYLNALWGDYKNNPNPPSGEHDPNFYYDRLRPLFFGGLNNPQSRDATSYAASRTIFGDVPFLNGGLFEKSDWDERYSVIVPDAVIKSIRDDLFNRFNFTVMESTPLDIEVAVDPEMLGKVFEELVTGRHDSGSYYTPRPVVSFMCREALKRYLEGAVADLDAEAIAQFVDERDPIGISLTAAPEVAKALDDVTVIDPACGSGAYLLGMMQELVELQTKLYNVGVDARSLYELKLHVIQRSLYGVDIDDFAVNIAMLRLWLSLAIEFEGDKPEPLPNLDFKIVTGDSLLGPDPSPSNYGDLFRNRVRQVADKLADLKAQHMGSTEDKAELRDEIERVQRDLTGTLEDFPASKEALDWRIEFAEVFRDGGFDLAIANPPYIDSETMTRRNPDERKQLSGMYSSAKGNWDYYICFWERSMSLLNSSGMAILITPNKWLGICYGRALRSMLKHHINTIADLSTFQVFENAQVSPVVVGAMKNHLDSGFHIMRFDDTYSVSMELSRSRIELLSTDQWGAMLSVYADNILDWTERHPSLIDFCSVRDPFATREAYELKDILVDNSRLVEPHFRLVNTGTIDPFQHYGQKRQRPISSKSTYFLSLMSNCSGNSSLDVTNR